MSSRHIMNVGLLCGMVVPLTGCTHSNPFQRPGTWHETNAPMHNIAVELVNPRDLHRGHGDRVLTGAIAVDAVGSALTSNGSNSATSRSTPPSGSVGGFGASVGTSPSASSPTSTPR